MYKVYFLLSIFILVFVANVFAADVICTWDIQIKDTRMVDLNKNEAVEFNKIIDNTVVEGSCNYFTSHSMSCANERNMLVTLKSGRLYVMDGSELVKYKLAGKTFDKSSYDYLKTLRRCDVFTGIN